MKLNRIEALKKLPKPTLLAIAQVSGSDGHTLFKPSAYCEAGMPDELVSAFTTEFKSDTRDPKSTIFKNGKVVPALQAVYGLTVVESIASALGLSVGDFNGRGFRAQAAFAAITKATQP